MSGAVLQIPAFFLGKFEAENEELPAEVARSWHAETIDETKEQWV